MAVEDSMTRILASDAPPAIGPYSQAIATGGLIFCTGQVAIDPATDQIIEGDIRDQTRQVLENLDAVLRAAGSSLRYVVKTTVFLVHFGDFAAMNEVYAEYFNETLPARSTVEVGALPRNLLVQIDCIAVMPGSGSAVRVIEARDSRSTFDLDLDSDF